MASNLVFDFRHHYVVGERRASEPSAYQFDQGHLAEIYVPENATSWEIHYAFGDFPLSEGYNVDDVEAADDGGYVITAHVPNDLFERSGELRVYLMAVEEESIITTYEGYVFIKNRNQPDDYVDDDPDNHATHLLEEAEAAAALAQEAAESIVNYYPTETAQGNPASFDDGADNIPVKDLKVSIVPHQAGSGDPSPDNVRPITGMTEVEVERTGKNLLPVTTTNETKNGITITNLLDGTIKVTGTATALTQFYVYQGFAPNGTFILNGCPTGGSTTTFDLRTDNANDTGANVIDFGSGATVVRTNMQTNMSILATIRNGYACPSSGLIFRPMIRLASDTDATFEPYHTPQTVTTDLGRTVYGGTLDVTTGVLTVDKVMLSPSELQTLGNYGVDNKPLYYFDLDIYIKEYGNFGMNPAYKLLSNKYISITVPDQVNMPNNNIRTQNYNTGTANRIYIRDDRFASLEEANADLALHPLQIVAVLATPQTYQLTPQEVLSVLGTNHISTDADSVDVVYRADIALYIENLTKPGDDDMVANNAITSGKFFMVNNRLFLSTASIAKGATITPGTNATELSLSDALNSLA